MKSSVANLFAVLAVLPCASAESAPPRTSAMRDVVTHDQIVEIAREAKKVNPVQDLTPVETADPTVATRPKDLIERSDIISFQGKCTLVPKRAIIHVPKEMAQRLGLKEGDQLGSWLDFLNANRAWIRTVPVTRTQAEGREPMGEDTLKSFEKEKRLVVATYQDGPISVMPLIVPPPEAQGASGTAAVSKPTTTNVSKP